MRIILALDAGGTHTRCAVLAPEGRVLGVGEGGPANWSTLGAEAVCRSAREAVTGAHRAAGLGAPDASEILGACMGLAGYYPPWHAAEAAAALAPVLGGRLRLEPDLTVAWAGATVLGPGVIVVAGTGSVAYGEDGAGRTARAGGWGPLAGDEGSAPWIGAAALRAIGRALDGRGPATALVEALGEPALTPEERLRSVYRDGWGRAELAALAPKVAAAALAGDGVAGEIFGQAAAALAELALAVLRTLVLERGAATVSLTGGVTAAREPLLDPFRRWLAATAPSAVVTAPRLSPLAGAALLARQSYAAEPGVSLEPFPAD